MTTGQPIADAQLRKLLTDWARQPTRGVIFDFNGTLSDDEPILQRIFADIFASHLGWQMTPEEYRDRLLGRSDKEIVELAVFEHGGGDAELAERLLELRQERYQEAVVAESPITAEASELVQLLAGAGVPMAIVTGALRADVMAALSNSQVADLVTHLVTLDDVEHGKPDPEGFLRAARLMGLAPNDVLVFEDSVPGVDAALRAGMQCVAITGDQAPSGLRAVAPALARRLGPDIFRAVSI